MTAAALTAREGDTLDLLLWRERGLGPAALAEVLAGNPGLAATGPVLPAGTTVLVAVDLSTSPTREVVQLWD